MTAIERAGFYPEQLSLPPCIADDPAYTPAFEEWATDCYEKSPTPLFRLRSLAQMSLPHAWETVVAKGGAALEYLSARQEDYTDRSEEEAREMLWADIMHAEVVDSPIGIMYDELYPSEPRKLEPTGAPVIDFLPQFDKEPGMTPGIYLDANGPVARVVSSGYYSLQMAYDVNRRVYPADPQERVCKRAARMLTHATPLEPRSAEDFTQAMRWIGYGEQLYNDTYSLHKEGVKIDFGKFGSNSEDTPTFKDFQELSRIFDMPPEERQPEITRYLTERIAAEQAKPDGDQQHIAKLQNVLADTDTQPAWFDERYTAIRKEHFATACLGQKAVELHVWLRLSADNDEQVLAPCVPWLSKASRELIEDTHRRLGTIDPGDRRARTRIDREATLRYLFGAEVVIDEKALKWSSHLLAENMEPLKKLIAFVNSRGEELSPDEVFRLATIAEENLQELNNLLGQGHTLKELAKSPGLALSLPREGQDLFPADIRSSAVRHHWLVNNAETYLGGGWNKVKLGRFLAAQLQAGDTIDLDTASKVLEHFEMPRAEDGKLYFDTSTEKYYLASMLSLSAELREKAQFSAKQAHIDQLFHFSDNAALYKAIVELHNSGEPWTMEALRTLVEARREQYYAECTDPQNPQTTERITAENFYQQLEDNLTLLGQISNAIQAQPALQITHLSKLRQQQNVLQVFGKNRATYIQDATAWLLKHATNPAWQLATAWQYRPGALAAGAKDTAREIIHWYQKNQFAYHFASTERVNSQPSNAEIYQRHEHWFDELLRYYPPGLALEAVRACAPTQEQASLLPATLRNIQLENDKEVLTGEILGPDDPRGLTIGRDSGCCMNWDVAALRPLLKAAYQLPEAGFFAITNKANRMVAQSAYFVDPAHPDTLVIDSIEPTAGRSAQKVVDLYAAFWRDYLAKRSQDTPDWQVHKVNIGIPKYLDEDDGLYQVYQKLPQVEPIVHEKMGYHADSAKQCQLLDLTEEELARPVADELSPRRKITKPSLHLVTARDKEEIVSDLSRQIFADGLNERERLHHFSAVLATKKIRQFRTP